MSEKQKKKERKKSQTRADVAIPSVSIDKLHEVIRYFYYSNAHQEPISGLEVAKRFGQRASTISNQVGFLQKVGILKPVGRASLLTEDGTKLATALDVNDKDTVYKIWRVLLKNYEPVNRIIQTMKAKSKPFSEEDMVAHLKNIVGIRAAKLSPHHQTGLKTIKDLMLKSNIIVKVEKDQFIPKEEDQGEDEEEIDREEKENKRSLVTSSIFESILGQSGPRLLQESEEYDDEGLMVNLDITLTISSGDDPQKIKKLILAIREAVSEPISNTRDERKEELRDSETDDTIDP